MFGDAQNADSTARQSNTFRSGVFGDSIQEKSGRKRLGGQSKGTSGLFGDEGTGYAPSSQNTMIDAPKEIYRPEKKTKDASSAKAGELYGKTADAYGFNKAKKDGALMTSAADWKNSHQQATNKSSPVKGKNMDTGADSKHRKYAQLQSSVFGGGYQEGAEVVYDKEAGRNAFGSNADWKTEAGHAKPINAGSTRVDTYGKKKQQLASNVFEQTDYSEHAPIKKTPVDINNHGVQKTTIAKGRKVDDEFKAGVRGFEPVKKDYSGYSAKDQKQGFLASSLGPSYSRPATGSNN